MSKFDEYIVVLPDRDRWHQIFHCIALHEHNGVTSIWNTSSNCELILLQDYQSEISTLMIKISQNLAKANTVGYKLVMCWRVMHKTYMGLWN